LGWTGAGADLTSTGAAGARGAGLSNSSSSTLWNSAAATPSAWAL